MTPPSPETWRGVKARLLLMNVLDPLRWRFGARTHRYRLHPPLDAADLAAFEAARGLTLPADYASFLTSVGDGGAGPHYGLLPLAQSPGPGDVRRPFPLTHGFTPARDEDGDIPLHYLDGYLLLSDIGCGYSAVLVVTGPAAGTVWNELLAGGGGFRPTGHTFASWYRAWLWPSLRRRASSVADSASPRSRPAAGHGGEP